MEKPIDKQIPLNELELSVISVALELLSDELAKDNYGQMADLINDNMEALALYAHAKMLGDKIETYFDEPLEDDKLLS